MSLRRRTQADPTTCLSRLHDPINDVLISPDNRDSPAPGIVDTTGGEPLQPSCSADVRDAREFRQPRSLRPRNVNRAASELLRPFFTKEPYR